MGQRLTITESEKNRIKGLYEQQSQQQKVTKIQGISLDDLRNQMRSIPPMSIDPNSFAVDLSTKTITFKSGNVQAQSLSFIFDDRGDLANRMPQILAKNPTAKVALKVNSLETPMGPIQYSILYFI